MMIILRFRVYGPKDGKVTKTKVSKSTTWDSLCVCTVEVNDANSPTIPNDLILPYDA